MDILVIIISGGGNSNGGVDCGYIFRELVDTICNTSKLYNFELTALMWKERITKN